jgi:hypothetical protein
MAIGMNIKRSSCASEPVSVKSCYEESESEDIAGSSNCHGEDTEGSFTARMKSLDACKRLSISKMAGVAYRHFRKGSHQNVIYGAFPKWVGLVLGM